MNDIRIATRNSPLALWQANYIKDRLEQVHPELAVEIVGMTTQGDQMLDRSLSTVGGKGLFLKELEVSLLNKQTDIAVHSMKDVPVELPKGLEITTICERADPRDAFVSNAFDDLESLPAGARVGTSSLRRISQLKNAFPELVFVELRGNVNTRLRKLDEGEYDAIILAAAGLQRLEMGDRIKQLIAPEVCLPAVGQGIIGIECRKNDVDIKALLEPLHDKATALVLSAERAMNAELQGGCQVPIAGYAEMVGVDKLHMRGLVGSVDGSKKIYSELHGHITNTQALGKDVALALIEQGANDILSDLRHQSAAANEAPQNLVLLTRQMHFLGNTLSLLNALDYQAEHVPVIEVETTQSTIALYRLENVASYDDVVFISRNAVLVGMEQINQHGGMPKDVRVMAVGKETAKQLFGYKIDAMFPDKGNGAEALMQTKQLQNMTDRKVLIVRGSDGLDWLGNEMRRRGAHVEYADCYHLSLPHDSAQMLSELMVKYKQPYGVFLHSVQSAANLLTIAKQYAPNIMQSKAVVGSERIAKYIRMKGWQGNISVAESPSNKHMLLSFAELGS